MMKNDDNEGDGEGKGKEKKKNQRARQTRSSGGLTRSLLGHFGVGTPQRWNAAAKPKVSR